MESKDLVVDQVLAEYQAYCAGQLSALLGTSDAPDGRVEYCGDENDPAHWTICYVRASDGAVRPIAVGRQERVLAEFHAMDRRGVPVWDPLFFPPPVAVLGGHEYPFKAARGRHLLGVVRLERQAVLLAAADDRLVAVLLVDGVVTTYPLGRPRALREVDVDLMRAFTRPTTAATTKPPDEPLRPSPQTKTHHIRIVPGRRVELGDGPTISEVLEAAFADIQARATTPRTKPQRRKQAAVTGKAESPAAVTKRPKLIGKQAVPIVLEYLRKMALRGCRDLVGLTGDIIRAIQARFKDFKITGEAFADALKLIASTGTCLIGPRASGGRIWELKLAGLNDPTSAHHIRLCRETRSRVRLEEAAANQRAGDRAVPADTQAAMDVEEAPGDAADTRSAAESASTGEARGTPADPSPGCSAGPTPSATTITEHGSHPEAPAYPVVAAARAEILDLVDWLGMNPIGGFMLLLWCLLRFDEPRTAATRADPDVVGDTSPHAEATPTTIATNNSPAPIDLVVIDETSLQSDESTPINGDTERQLGHAKIVVHCAQRAPVGELPPLHPRDALTPAQPEPRCRDLGTLGPRGPPAHAERLPQPNDARSKATRRGRRWGVMLRRRAAGLRVSALRITEQVCWRSVGSPPESADTRGSGRWGEGLPRGPRCRSCVSGYR